MSKQEKQAYLSCCDLFKLLLPIMLHVIPLSSLRRMLVLIRLAEERRSLHELYMLMKNENMYLMLRPALLIKMKLGNKSLIDLSFHTYVGFYIQYI